MGRKPAFDAVIDLESPFSAYGGEWTPQRLNHLCNEFETWLMNPENSLWIKDFATYNNITFYELQSLRQKCPRFNRMWELALQRQEGLLVRGAVKMRFNSRFVSFLLQCNHGWTTEDRSIEEPVTCTYEISDTEARKALEWEKEHSQPTKQDGTST